MKATLHFDLPEDEPQFRDCMDGAAWRGLVHDLLEMYLRPRWKHETSGPQAADFAEGVRDWLVMEMDEAGLRLD